MALSIIISFRFFTPPVVNQFCCFQRRKANAWKADKSSRVEHGPVVDSICDDQPNSLHSDWSGGLVEVSDEECKEKMTNMLLSDGNKQRNADSGADEPPPVR